MYAHTVEGHYAVLLVGPLKNSQLHKSANEYTFERDNRKKGRRMPAIVFVGLIFCIAILYSLKVTFLNQ